MDKPPTIAQSWEDFKGHTYPRESALTMREYRVCFYSGFHAALATFAAIGRQSPTPAQTLAAVEARFEEWRQFAATYLAERQREG